MYEAARNARSPGQVDMRASECYDPFRFQRNHGRIYQWILLPDYQSVEVMMPFG